MDFIQIERMSIYLLKFKDYNYGLLILEPIKFLSSLTECLAEDPILIKSAEIKHAKVLYTDDELIIEEDDTLLSLYSTLW